MDYMKIIQIQIVFNIWSAKCTLSMNYYLQSKDTNFKKKSNIFYIIYFSKILLDCQKNNKEINEEVL